MEALFKSVLEQDRAPVVLCDLTDTIVYMNPAAAKHYEADGGMALVGGSIKACHPPQANAIIERVVDWFRANPANNLVYTFRNERANKDVYMVALRDSRGDLIGYYEKHEFRNVETMKLYDFSEKE